MTRSRLIGAALLIGLALITAFLYFESVNATSPAQIVGYQRTGDPAKIVIIVAVGQADDIAEREVQESAESVRITVHKHTRTGTFPDSVAVVPITVSLRTALGNRAVLNDKGIPVTDRGTYELPQPARSP